MRFPGSSARAEAVRTAHARPRAGTEPGTSVPSEWDSKTSRQGRRLLPSPLGEGSPLQPGVPWGEGANCCLMSCRSPPELSRGAGFCPQCLREGKLRQGKAGLGWQEQAAAGMHPTADGGGKGLCGWGSLGATGGGPSPSLLLGGPRCPREQSPSRRQAPHGGSGVLPKIWPDGCTHSQASTSHATGHPAWGGILRGGTPAAGLQPPSAPRLLRTAGGVRAPQGASALAAEMPGLQGDAGRGGGGMTPPRQVPCRGRPLWVQPAVGAA